MFSTIGMLAEWTMCFNYTNFFLIQSARLFSPQVTYLIINDQPDALCPIPLGTFPWQPNVGQNRKPTFIWHPGIQKQIEIYSTDDRSTSCKNLANFSSVVPAQRLRGKNWTIGKTWHIPQISHSLVGLSSPYFQSWDDEDYIRFAITKETLPWY